LIITNVVEKSAFIKRRGRGGERERARGREGGRAGEREGEIGKKLKDEFVKLIVYLSVSFK